MASVSLLSKEQGRLFWGLLGPNGSDVPLPSVIPPHRAVQGLMGMGSTPGVGEGSVEGVLGVGVLHCALAATLTPFLPVNPALQPF